MLKFRYLAAVVIPIAVEVTFSQSLRAQSLYPPEVSSSAADTLVCYMQTADGRLLQLESFCQGETSAGASQQTSSRSANQSFSNSGSGLSAGTSVNQGDRASSPHQDDSADSSGPAQTAMCMPATAPECTDIDFAPAVPDFVPDSSPVPVSQ